MRNGRAVRGRPAAWCRCRSSTTASRSRSRRLHSNSRARLLLPPDRRGVVHPAGAAARATQRDEKRLPRILVEVDLLDHLLHLLLEQLVHRHVAEKNLLFGFLGHPYNLRSFTALLYAI